MKRTNLLLYATKPGFCNLQQKKYVSFFAVLLIALNSFSQPVISTFSPASGPVGTSVTISGSGFSSTPSANIVFFGAVKATVSAASASSLTVQVPAGATYQPITVTTNSLTAYSAKPFVVTFSNGVIHSKSFSFAGKADSVYNVETNDFEFGDLDGDGLADLATVDRYNNRISVYKNSSTGENFSFGNRINFTGGDPAKLALGDVDGDGKLDIAVSNQSGNTVSILKNTSLPGTISFASKIDFATGTQPNDLTFDDLDGDGKTDLAIVCLNLEGSVSFLRNTTSSGNISFAPKFDLVISSLISVIATAKLDSDARPDLIFTGSATDRIFVVKNNSSPGSFSFSAATTQATGRHPGKLAIGDLDGDGGLDVAVSNFFGNSVSIFRNTTVGSSISFAAKVDYATFSADGIAIGDLDGDSKADLATISTYVGIDIFKNNSSPGNFSFAKQDYAGNASANKIAIADINNDGKADLAMQSGIFRVVVWKNDATKPSIVAFTPTTAASGTTVTINGYNFSGATSVSFGGVPATSFTVVNSATITAVVGAAFSGDINVVTPNGTAGINGFVFAGPPLVSSFTPTIANRQTTITIKGKNFTGVTGVKFGGIPATFTTVVSPTTITAVAGNGASGDISVTNGYGTGSLAGFTFIPLPTITSFSPTGAVSGETVTITGTNLNGATSVSFGGTAAASFTVVSSTTITAVIGTGASGDVTVVTPGGTVSKSGFGILPTITSFTPTTGARGTSIRITGNNFSGITGVRFGGVNASSFTVNSSTSISAVVAGGSSGDVSLVTAAGTSSKPGFTFIPAPTISSFSPLTGGTGTIVTITGENFTNASSVSIGGSPASSFTVVSPTTIIAVVGNSSSGSVTVITPGGTATKGGFTFTTLPIITSFSPLSGPIGTTVTITGANFNAVASHNIVFFGAVRANVIASTNNSITVTVPPGASYKLITVTTGNLVASSAQPFTVTFAGGGDFTASSFGGKIDLPSGNNPHGLISGDFDNDGKPDIAAINNSSNSISVFKNLSNNGSLSFASKVDFSLGSQPYYISSGDLDGDGQLDLVVFTANNNKGAVLRNTSTNGSISFAPFQEFNTGFGASDLAIGDLTNDGKPELTVVNTNTSINGMRFITVLRNNSTSGNITLTDYGWVVITDDIGSSSEMPLSIAIADLNDDRRSELIIGYRTSYFRDVITILKGGSIGGNRLDITATFFAPTRHLAIGDFDLDGKPDIISENTVFRNLGNFSFDQQKIPEKLGPFAVDDLNGDGKLDYAKVDNPSSTVSVWRNTGTNSLISFAPYVNYTTGLSPRGIIINDFDGDGKPEIATANYNDNNITILKDQSAGVNTQVCSGSNKNLSTQNTGNTYQWQQDNGSGFVDISNSPLFQGVSTNTLTLSNIPASLNGYKYRCIVNGNPDIPFILTVNASTPAAVSITTVNSAICSGTNATFIATPTNGGSSPSYQWKVNGVNAGTNSNTFTSSTLNNNAQVSVVLTSNASCVTTPTANSNIITITVNPSSAPTITTTVSANNICAGTPVTFTATPANGGASPTYQWQVNNINVGTNSNSFTSSTLNNNDQVKVILTSNANCVSTTTATSTAITMIVNASTKLLGKASSPAQVCAGTSYNVSFTGTNIPNGSSVQLWESINNSTFNAQTTQIYNGTVLNFPVTSTNSGSKKYFFKITPAANNTCVVGNNSDTSTTVIDQLAKPAISVTANTITITNPDAGATYLWQVQDAGNNWINVNPATTGLSYTATMTGTYRARSDKGQCTQFSEAHLVSLTNPNTNPSNETVLLYPNPTQGILTLDSLKISDNWEVLDIVSLQSGQTVASFNIINKTKITVHLEALSNGIYLAVLRRRDGSSISIEFVKM